MLNRVILIGRLTRDPELRRTASGMAVSSFTIAVDDIRKGPNGEKNTLFMNCSIFGQQAENLVKYTRKGSLIATEGRLVQRSYVRKSDNQNVTVTEVTADRVDFLDPKGSAQPRQDAGYQPDPVPAPQVDNGAPDSIDVMDDDLPF